MVMGFLGGAVGLMLIAATGILSTVDPSQYLRSRQDGWSDSLSKHTGRKFSFGKVEKAPFPKVGAKIKDVKISGETPDGPPLFSAGSVDVEFSLWKALSSLGEDLSVESLSLQDVDVRTSRSKDGKWAFEQELKRFIKSATSTGAEGAADKPLDLSFLKDSRIEELTLGNGRVEIDDEVLGRPLYIDDIQITLRDIALEEPFSADISAVLVDGKKRTPLALRGKLARLPTDLNFSPFPAHDASLSVGAVDLAPWGGLAPADSLTAAGGNAAMILHTKGSEDLRQFSGLARIKGQGIQLRKGKDVGKPLDADLDVEFRMDAEKGRYELPKISWRGDGVEVEGGIISNGFSPADIEKADIKIHIDKVDKLLAVVPSSLSILPEGLTVEGKVDAKASGNEKDVELLVSMDDADVKWTDIFHKQSGRPLRARLKGGKKQGRLEVPEFMVEVDAAKMSGAMSLPQDKEAPVLADVKTEKIPLSTLHQLLPPVRKAINQGKPVKGTLQAKVKSSVADNKEQASAELSLKEFEAILERMALMGDGSVKMTHESDGQEQIQTVDVNLDDMSWKGFDEAGELKVHKPSGMSLRMRSKMKGAPQKAKLSATKLQIGDTALTGKGSVSGLDSDSPKLSLKFGDVEIGFKDLRKAIPGWERLPADGKLKSKLTLDANPSDLSSVILDASDAEITFGDSKLKGGLRWNGAMKPEITANFPDSHIELADLLSLLQLAPQPDAKGGFRGGVNMKGKPSEPRTQKWVFQIEELRIGDEAVKGEVAYSDPLRPDFSVRLEGGKLNLDEWMQYFEMHGDPIRLDALVNSGEEGKGKKLKTHGLSSSIVNRLKRASGQADLRFDEVVFDGAELSNVVAEAKINNGKAAFKRLDFGMYGGKANAAESQVNFGETSLPFNLKMKGEDIDVGQALSAHTESNPGFKGKTDVALDLRGAFSTPDEIPATLEGQAELDANDFALETLDLMEEIFGKLRTVAKKKRALKMVKSIDSDELTLGDVKVPLVFNQGKFQLREPVETQTEFGKIVLEGSADANSEIDMSAIVHLSPATIAEWTRGKVTPAEEIAVPLTIEGTWEEPEVTGINAKKLLKAVREAQKQNKKAKKSRRKEGGGTGAAQASRGAR